MPLTARPWSTYGTYETVRAFGFKAKYFSSMQVVPSSLGEEVGGARPPPGRDPSIDGQQAARMVLSQNKCLKTAFAYSQFTNKPVNLFFIKTNYKIKLKTGF